MSRRPGLAKNWYDQYSSDVYPSDFIVMREKKLKPPRYYDKLFEHENPKRSASIKQRRRRAAALHAENNTPDRLAIREQIQIEKFKQLKRSYENGT